MFHPDQARGIYVLRVAARGGEEVVSVDHPVG